MGVTDVPIEMTEDVRYIGRRRVVCHRAELGPISRTERTKTAARECLMRDVEDAIIGSFKPAMYFYGDAYVLVYRGVTGWSYRYGSTIDGLPNDSRPVVGNLYGVIGCGSDDRDSAIHRARLYLAQSVYPKYSGIDFLADDSEAVESYCRWIAFQRAYEQARVNRSFSDAECHRFAGSQSGELSRWLTQPEMEAYQAAKVP